jgi:predicted XRE-type DNA-binding protein
MPTLQCAQCQTPFHVPPSWEQKRRFCTPACREAWRAAQLQTCPVCSRQYHLPPSKAARNQTCGWACGLILRTRSHAERFWPKVATGDHCWEWRGYRDSNGYGRFSIGTQAHRSRTLLAHRVAWELTYGPIPTGQHVLHRCDNPSCVRPDHLFLGDQRANNADRDMKDRVRHGAQHPNAKLTPRQVEQVRTLATTGAISQRGIGRALGVRHSTVADILKGKTWRRS